MFEAGNVASVEQIHVANNAGSGIAPGFTGAHVAPGYNARAADPEHLPNLGPADDDFLQFRRQQTLHGLLNIFKQLVDNGVERDLHLLVAGRDPGCCIHIDVKAQHDRF